MRRPGTLYTDCKQVKSNRSRGPDLLAQIACQRSNPCPTLRHGNSRKVASIAEANGIPLGDRQQLRGAIGTPLSAGAGLSTGRMESIVRLGLLILYPRTMGTLEHLSALRTVEAHSRNCLEFSVAVYFIPGVVVGLGKLATIALIELN
jgi:hypothetical protein